MKETNYYVIKKKAVPEVLLKVLEVQKLLDSKRAVSVLEATEKVGISRSSYYKYKDDIFPFHENAKGRTITMMMQMDDEPGLLAEVLQVIAKYHANILTIHQTIPVNQIAMLTLSVEILPTSGDVTGMMNEIEDLPGMHYMKLIARE